MKNFGSFSESKVKLIQEKLRYGISDLEPSISKDTIDYHYYGLASKYVERYNKGEGDPDFNFGGAVLHNIYFGQFCEPSKSKFSGTAKAKIEDKFGSLSKMQDAIEEEAMKIQGSGWIYLDDNCEINVIYNHEYNPNMKIMLLIDWWEHAWALDYKSNKKEYLKNIYDIIDWSVISSRFITTLKEDSEVSSIPAGPQGQMQDILKNPSLMHNDINSSYQEASKMSSSQTDPADRAYILKYKYYQQQNIKPYVVVYNKTLLSQAPDWERRGYYIIGWVSRQDGSVIKTQDGKFVKGTP
jgi:superoxide dismutase, Fe-Mn family